MWQGSGKPQATPLMPASGHAARLKPHDPYNSTKHSKLAVPIMEFLLKPSLIYQMKHGKSPGIYSLFHSKKECA
jgi:hypothetical protein